jgi:hypothetical protein
MFTRIRRMFATRPYRVPVVASRYDDLPSSPIAVFEVTS